MDYQCLSLPANNCQLEAGRKDRDYFYQYGYDHYGHDYGHPAREKFNVLSSGEGTVMLAAKERGDLCYVLIIKYPNVYMPQSKTVVNVVARYYHMEKICVTKGQKVIRGDIVGIVGNTITGLKHVHVEVDSDYVNYTYSPQVASTCLYLKQGYRDSRDTTFNPASVFYIGKNQVFKPHPVDTFYCKDDIVTRIVPNTVTYQKLILPINDCKVNASQYSTAYRLDFNMTHYGVDLISKNGHKYLYGCGNGEVLLSGYDNVFGNTLIVLYKNVLDHVTGEIKDIILRYFHMATVKVKVGQSITIDTYLGDYGNTGQYSAGAHLHVSADYDTHWYNYEAGLAASSNLIKKGNDSTMFNPMEVFHIKATSPEKQSISLNSSTHNGYLYANIADSDLPTL